MTLLHTKRGRRALAWNGPLVTLLGLVVAALTGLALIQLSPLQGVLVLGLLAVVIGALVEPFIALGAALFVGPFKAYLAAQWPQVPAQVGHAFVALALASWLMRELSQRKVHQTEHASSLRSPLLLPLLGFFGAAMLSLWDAVGLVAHGVPELIKWAEIVLVFVFVKDHLAVKAASPPTHFPGAKSNSAARRLHLLVTMLLAAGVFQALIGIWQFGLRGEGPEPFRIMGGDFFRAYGTFQQPNPYAGYLGLTTALALGVVLEATRSRWVNWYRMGLGRADVSQRSTHPEVSPPIGLSAYLFGGAAVGTMLVALLASWSRGAWIGFGAAGLVMTAALPRKAVWSVALIAMLIIGSTGLHASGSLPASFTARLTSFVEDIRLEDVRGVPINDANYAVIERLAHWQAAMSMVRHNLWTGVGFGCYEAAYPAFALINWPLPLGHAHNIYLNLAAETGLIGLAAYLTLWGMAFWQTWRVTRRARGLVRALAVGLLGAWTHMGVHHLLDNLYVNNVHLHISAMLGLAAFIIQQTNQKPPTYDR